MYIISLNAIHELQGANFEVGFEYCVHHHVQYSGLPTAGPEGAHKWEMFVACMLNVSFGSLKQSADYNLRLEFLILPSSGRLKQNCDTCIIHFYYTLEQL